MFQKLYYQVIKNKLAIFTGSLLYDGLHYFFHHGKDPKSNTSDEKR